MLLEIGKKYITKNGSIVTVDSLLEATDSYAFGYAFNCTIRDAVGDYQDSAYTQDGYYWADQRDHKWNIVSEALFKLKVGVKYLMRSGDTVVLHDCGSETSLEGDNGYYYTYALSGFVFDDEECNMDIIGLAPEEVNVDDMARDFDSQWEIWKWLVEGFKVISKETKIVYWFDKGKIKAHVGQGLRDTINIFSEINAYEKYREPPKWHEFKTKGQVLCNVEDSLGNTNITLVVSFDGTTYRDITGKDWLFAKPVSLDDMTKYIWECE